MRAKCGQSAPRLFPRNSQDLPILGPASRSAHFFPLQRKGLQRPFRGCGGVEATTHIPPRIGPEATSVLGEDRNLGDEDGSIVRQMAAASFAVPARGGTRSRFHRVEREGGRVPLFPARGRLRKRVQSRGLKSMPDGHGPKGHGAGPPLTSELIFRLFRRALVDPQPHRRPRP